MRDNLGQFIKEQRIKNKISQNKLAEILFIDRTLISKWENGKANPSMNEIVKMSELFNISIEEFISGETYTKTNKEEIKTNLNNYLINQDNKITKFKKRLLYSFIIILLILTSFFTYYFYNTYNKTIVYRVGGEIDNYLLDSGVLLLTRGSSYMKIGYFNLDIKEIEIYYKDNDIKNIIYKGNPNNVKIDNNGYNSSINIKNFNKIKNNIYMDIYNNKDELFTMKLEFRKDFINDKFVFKDETKYAEIDNNIDNLNNSKFIKENFKCENNLCTYKENNLDINLDQRNYTIIILDESKTIIYYIKEKSLHKLINNKEESLNENELNFYKNIINKILEIGE